MTEIWTKEKIINLLKTNNRAVEKAILFLFSQQEKDEQETKSTIHHNGKGFSAAHDRHGSYLATWLLKDERNRLTGKHLNAARRISLRYVGQLLERANSHHQT